MKSFLHNSIADGLYNEVISRYSRYYYFLGRTLSWEDELSPPTPINSYAYDLQTRNEIITMKEIKPTDIAYVVYRYDWVTGTVYDQFDDQYSTEVQGIDLQQGGYSYATAPNVYIGSYGASTWVANTSYTTGTMIKVVVSSNVQRTYIVTNTGVSGTTAPTHTTGTVLNGTGTLMLQYFAHNDGNGTGATAAATVLDGQVIDIEMTHRGSGYESAPTVAICGGGGAAAVGVAKVNISTLGYQTLEESRYYVITDEYNVYMCLDNNNGAASVIKPTGTSSDVVSTSDGYLWKFIYTVPIALRNKFLTDQYMPVVTALRNQFYSSGNLQTIRIDSAGSGYSSGTITVQGDGSATGEQVHLTTAVISGAGSGYVSPTITIDPPYTGAVTWQASSTVLVGQILTYQNNIYEVAISGVTGSTGPVHRFNTVANGTASLHYKGTTATGVVTVNGSGGINSLTMYGMLRDIVISINGSGYTSPPAITFSGGSGTGATAVAVLQNGCINQIKITGPGSSFTSAPSVIIGTQWTANTAVTTGQQIYYSNRLYTVTVSGTTHASTAPTHLSGSASNGTATLAYAGVQATATASLKYGSGYNSYPSVTITGAPGTGGVISISGVKTEAKLLPIFAGDTLGQQWTSSTSFGAGLKVWYSTRLYTVTSAGTTSGTAPTHTSGTLPNGTATLKFEGYFGQLIGVQIDDAGEGYTYANLNVTGTGTGASVSADLSPGDVNTLQANIELLTVDGRIMNCPVISGGYGYGDAQVTIVGDGSGATATASISQGVITKINMTSYGSGYRWASVIISGSGDGARARVIIGPYGGYGKEALNNLFARTLMFYSNISQDKNQGFDVNNDYRQLGIIKGPRQYGNTNPLTSILASACWVISGSISTSLFPADTLITNVATGARFRIVTNTGSSALVQSLDNAQIAIGNTFTNSSANVFVCSTVTPPTVDKYSGDLLFIDNKEAFTPTTDETVTLRTVIRF
jgi:hypothetical protein